MDLNKQQIGGDHYKSRGSVSLRDINDYAQRLGIDSIQHWDLAVLFAWDPYQYQITKYVMRWKDKDGTKDLKKGLHFYQKYAAIAEADALPLGWGSQRPVTLDLDRLSDAEKRDLIDGMRSMPGGVVMVNPPEPNLRDFDFSDLVNPSAWTGFTYEGADANGELYTCTKCRNHFYIPHGRAPRYFHLCGLPDAKPAGRCKCPPGVCLKTHREGLCKATIPAPAVTPTSETGASASYVNQDRGTSEQTA